MVFGRLRCSGVRASLVAVLSALVALPCASSAQQATGSAGGQSLTAAHRPDAAAEKTAGRAISLRRKGGGPELLAFRDGTAWRDVRSEDINGYLKELAQEDISAKDFRTWHGTVLTAALLASQEEVLTSVTSRKRVVSAVVREVADALGNTPAVCRASYIDPRVIDRFLNGETIDLPRGKDLTNDRVRRAVESSVLDLLEPEHDRRRAA